MSNSRKRKKPSRNPAKPPKASAPRRPQPTDEEAAVWVKTVPTVDGKGWMLSVEYDDDNAMTLDRQGAMDYARTILEVCATYEYEAAVIKQWTDKLDQKHGMQLVVDLRKDRPEPDQSALGEMRLEGGVSAMTGEAFLTIFLRDRPLAQWDPAQARDHALFVLEALAVADMDAAYLRCLVGVVGASDDAARGAVADLQNYRTEYSR